MCYRPNIVREGHFCGGLKNYLSFPKHSFTPYTPEQKTKLEALVLKELKEGKAQLVPCGQCLQCRIQYAAMWAARCETEIRYHDNNLFVTLTYDEDHVPVYDTFTKEHYRKIRSPADYLAGKSRERLTLAKEDIQKFWKRLRITAKRKGWYDNPEWGITIYYAGEYGGKTFRPHYHAIIYGLRLPDLVENPKVPPKGGHVHFKSAELEKIWGCGFVDIGSVTFNSCQYVARYVLKKQSGLCKKADYEAVGIEPEFVHMSLKPGIGQRYWGDYREEIYERDKLYLAEGRKMLPPRFFDMKEDELQCFFEGIINEDKEIVDPEALVLQRVESDFMRDIKKKRRKRANDRLEEELKRTTLGLDEYMDAKKMRFENQHKRATMRDQI